MDIAVERRGRRVAGAAGLLVPCTDCPLRLLDCFREFTAEELDFVQGFKQGERLVKPGEPILLEQTSSPHLYTVLEGWAFRYKTLSDGRRQILNYLLPGDFIGLQGSALGNLDHSVEALSDMMLCIFNRRDLWSVYTTTPSLAFDVTWLAAHEERLLDANLLTVGRRTAIERVAYVLWHLYDRAERRGMVTARGLVLPLTQQHLADTLGLSLVHTNKTLRKLRATGCVSWHDHVLEVMDGRKLRHLAKADEATIPSTRPFI